ncbi:hypothetical protein QBC37DRAFT_289577 [Rhypophila decipiens]|uniref:Uncharacterized protein n=1 Tax=Rhypophila decipiens TaxID=261697 RepID=A0AAN6Y317_9PEZI|nr:hypothetical protein QBC37DRAFT_289577 [Rhypophila decipiens]
MAAIPVPVPASVLVDGELARRVRFKPGTGNILTGCKEIDEYVLLGGFERGSVVGLSCEDDEVGLLIGLQTASHLLVTALLGNDGRDTNYPKVTIITMSPLNVLVPKLRQILVNQLATFPAGLQNINGNVKRCLEQISISMVFDIEGLQEVLGEIRDSEDEDDDCEDQVVQGPIVRSESSSSPLSDPPDHLEDLFENEAAVPAIEAVPEIEALDTRTEPPKTDSKPPPPPPLPPTPKVLVDKPPDLILITHMTSLMNALFTARDKPAFHETMASLSSQLRQVTTRPTSSNHSFFPSSDDIVHVSRPPLVILLNSTTMSYPSRFIDIADVNNNKPEMTALKSIFQHDQPGSSSKKKTKPSFGMVFSQLLHLHLLCTRVPRKQQYGTKKDTAAGDGGPYATTQHGSVGGISSSHRFTWAVEVLLDGVGVYGFEHVDDDDVGETSEYKDGRPGTGLQEEDRMRIRRRCREQRWAAVEVDEGGGGIVDIRI